MKKIFDWNHISSKLTESRVKELKCYYRTYHRKCWAYKQAVKKLRKYKLAGNSLSVIFASGGLAAAIATSGISLVAISTISLLIQGWMKQKNLDSKIQNCVYAYQSYQHLLNLIKETLRSGEFNIVALQNNMTSVDCYVVDNAPFVDKFIEKYDKIYAD